MIWRIEKINRKYSHDPWMFQKIYYSDQWKLEKIKKMEIKIITSAIGKCAYKFMFKSFFVAVRCNKINI